MTIIEGNKLIAEFMGWEKSPYPNTPDKLYRDDDKNEKQLSIHVSQLLYHSSWDWLMPVVDKIGNKIIKYNLTPNNVIFRVEEDDSFDVVVKTNGNLLNATWEACVQFIQWYNENKTL